MSAKWYYFDPRKGYLQKRPPLRRYVLVALAAQGNDPATVCVGYRKDGAGDKNSPYFVTPGVGQELGDLIGQGPSRFAVPCWWCDCLGDDFKPPVWVGEQT